MLDHRRPRHLFAALILLVGQWLLFAHAIDHALNGTPEQASCEICAVAHAAAPSPPPPALPAVAAGSQPAPLHAIAALIAAAQLRLPPGCGPPSSLA